MLPAARRPLLLATLSTICLAGLLAGGLVVARAVVGSPSTEPVDTTSSASAAPTGSAEHGSNAGGNGDDNAAVALNTKDGSAVYAIRLKVVLTGAESVDAETRPSPPPRAVTARPSRSRWKGC